MWLVAGWDPTFCGWWVNVVSCEMSAPSHAMPKCSSPSLYYKVLLQYYSVLQSTTPVLVCTTKYYSSTSLYYKALLQYYSVQHSSTPVLLYTTQIYSSTTLYYKILLQYYSVLQNTTPVLLCTTKYYSLQGAEHQRHQMLWLPRKLTHQILPLPRKMTLMIDVRRIWNVIYNARRNRSHPPTSPNAAPATQNDSHHLSSWHMKRYLQCAEEQASPANLTKYCACHAKWLSWLIFVTYETSFTMRGATGITLQPHQILRLPRKMTLMIDVRHTWHVIYNARSNRSHPPTSPNAAPATQNDSHHLSSWHMKRYLQCAEEQASPANLTKYCACHAKWLSWLIFVTYGTSFTMRGATGITLQPHQILRLPRKSAFQNLSEILRERLKRQFQCAADSTMIRPWSDHDPTMNSSSRTRPFAEVTFRASETHFVLKITTFRAPAIYPNFTKHCACHEKWHSNITKCCACHAKLLASSILVTYATLFTMRGGTGITRQPHQILRLPRKMTLMIDLRHIWNVIYNARSNRHHPPTSPNTAPATQKCFPKSKRNSPRTVESSIPMRGRFDHDPTMIRPWSDHDPTMNSSSRTRPFAEVTFRASETHFVLKITTFRAPAIYPNFTKYCACHEKWHSKITKYCACHEKWHSKITKCCACHEKWPWTVTWLHSYLNSAFTKLLLDWTVTTELLLDWTVPWLNCCLTERLLYWAVTLLSCYFTELLLDWAVTLLSCYFTELLLYGTVTWLSCYLTELLLYWAYWAVTLLSCYFTELLLYWTVTLLFCYFTELLLYWAVTLLSCYFTELLLYWTVTLLSCYFTELLLYWAVTLLSCYFTELLLYWTATLLSCYFTVLLLYWTLCIFKSP